MYNKKILFIWNDLSIGGAERALINITHKLKHSFNIKIVLYNNKIEFKDDLSNLEITSVINSNNRLPKILKHILLFIKLIYIIPKYDYIIIHDIPLLVVCTGLIKKIFPSKKYFYWIHICKSEIKQVNNNFYTKIIKLILSNSSCICVSKTAKLSLIKYLNNTNIKINVIYNIFDPIKLHTEKTCITPYKNSNLVIALLGRLSKEKRVDRLIESANILISKYKFDNFIIKIIGDSPKKNKLERLILKYSLEKKVIFTGMVSKPLRDIKNSNIVISCSDSESLSYSIIEALYCRKPVIVTNTGAAEVIEYGKYGIVLSEKTPEVLAEAIYKLAINPLLRNRLAAKAHLALEKFDSSKIIKQWEKLLNS